MQEIFLNYRREDAGGFARALYGDLSSEFGAGVVFRDVDTLSPGVNFDREIRTMVAGCKVFLVLMGRNWADARNADGTRRLDDPHDYVRVEVEAALKQKKVSVIPVLVQGAKMPTETELPRSLKGLITRNAIKLDDDRWEADVSRLASAIERSVPRLTSSGPIPIVEATGETPTVPLEVPAPAAPAPDPEPARTPSRLRLLVVSGAVVVALLVGTLVVLASGGDETDREKGAVLAAAPSSSVATSTSTAPLTSLEATGPTVGRSSSGATAGTGSGSGSSGPGIAPTTVPPPQPSTTSSTVRTTTTAPLPDPGPGQFAISPTSGSPGTTIQLFAGSCARPNGWTGGEIYYGLNNPVRNEDTVTGRRWWDGAGWRGELVVPAGTPAGRYTVWANCFAWDPVASAWSMFHYYGAIDFNVR